MQLGCALMVPVSMIATPQSAVYLTCTAECCLSNCACYPSHGFSRSTCACLRTGKSPCPTRVAAHAGLVYWVWSSDTGKLAR